MTDRDSIHNEPDECGDTLRDIDASDPYCGLDGHVCVAPDGHTDWHACPCGETWP